MITKYFSFWTLSSSHAKELDSLELSKSLKQNSLIFLSFYNHKFEISDQYIGSFIKYDITRSMLLLIEQSAINCGLNSRFGSIAISVSEIDKPKILFGLRLIKFNIILQFFQFETPIFGSYDENFITYASAAMLCL